MRFRNVSGASLSKPRFRPGPNSHVTSQTKARQHTGGRRHGGQSTIRAVDVLPIGLLGVNTILFVSLGLSVAFCWVNLIYLCPWSFSHGSCGKLEKWNIPIATQPKCNGPQALCNGRFTHPDKSEVCWANTVRKWQLSVFTSVWTATAVSSLDVDLLPGKTSETWT